MLDSRVRDLIPKAPWDGAIPGATVMDRVLRRLLRGEVMLHAGRHQVLLLLDIRKFYDSILRDVLVDKALDL